MYCEICYTDINHCDAVQPLYYYRVGGVGLFADGEVVQDGVAHLRCFAKLLRDEEEN